MEDDHDEDFDDMEESGYREVEIREQDRCAKFKFDPDCGVMFVVTVIIDFCQLRISHEL